MSVDSERRQLGLLHEDLAIFARVFVARENLVVVAIDPVDGVFEHLDREWMIGSHGQDRARGPVEIGAFNAAELRVAPVNSLNGLVDNEAGWLADVFRDDVFARRSVHSSWTDIRTRAADRPEEQAFLRIQSYGTRRVEVVREDHGARCTVHVARHDVFATRIGEVDETAHPVDLRVLDRLDASGQDELVAAAVFVRLEDSCLVSVLLVPIDEPVSEVASDAVHLRHPLVDDVVLSGWQVDWANVVVSRNEQCQLRTFKSES